MKKILATIPLLMLSLTSFGQTEKEIPPYENRTQTRMSVAIEKKFLDKTLSIDFSPEIRLGDDFNYDKTLLNLGVDYDVMGWFDISIGGRVTFNETKKRGTETTARIDAGISRTFKAGKFRIKPSIKYNHYENIKNTKNDPKNDFMRYKLLFKYKYAKKAIFEPEVGVDFFHNLKSNKISIIRYSVGGDFRVTKRNSIGIKYLLDQEFITRINTHIIEVGYKYKF